ncbi:hypothetical protein EV421DRAFT_1718725, partial [Armillaria borealis]
FDEICSVAFNKKGVHVKMAEILRRTFKDITEVGDDIYQDKRRRTMPRTYKDTTVNTMFLD